MVCLADKEEEHARTDLCYWAQALRPDSVASAYGYARLLQLQGEAQPIAARQGELKPEVRFVLERFHVDPPLELEDVYLRVCDVMQRQMLSISLDRPLLEAGRLLQEYHRL